MAARLGGIGLLVASLVVAAAGGAAPAPAGAGEMAGRVDFEDGTAAAGAVVRLLPGNWSAVAGPDGSFRVEVPAGHYTLRASFGEDGAQREVDVRAGEVSVEILRIVRAGYVTGALNPTPFVFLIAAMAAVFAGGFYVNRRMAGTGLDLNKSVLGGAPVRKPFRRRRRAQPPSNRGNS
jgi:carboxypeptidase family protein